ncbi:hypothetical protein HOC35_04300 [Candidatus Woesearchaeota archaeon]|jgi:hypothetical protein|nr:hypothetical protein [Candidatus Woesearchaeota archaeon]
MDWSKLLVGNSNVPKEEIIKRYKKAILPLSIALFLIIFSLILYLTGVLK